MKKVLLFFGLFLFLFVSMHGQTSITIGMTGAQTRNAINNNFIGIYPITYNTTSSTIGVVNKGGVRFIHNYPGRMSSTYAGSGTDSAMIGKSLYIGLAAGNFTMNKRTGCNTTVGDSTGFSLTTGLANTFVGFSAGKYNTSGQRNVFVGRQAGWRNTTAHSNTFIGESSGERNTTGGSNVLIGTNAGQYMKGGTDNTGVGFNSLFGSSLTPGNTGVYNSALGDGTGAAITDGSYNVFIGGSAGALMTTGDNNVMIGMSTGASNVPGIYNVYVGAGAFYSQTSGDNNVALGSVAGRNNISGSGNLFLGNGAGYYETGSNKLFIDNTLRSSEADGRLKALVYGTFATNPVDQRFVLNGIFKMTPIVSPPASGEEGMFYFDTDHYPYYYNGTTWVQIGAAGSMTYPGAGIPLSTGSAWGTSITNNSANWNTAYGWGNHASAGYLHTSDTATMLSHYALLSEVGGGSVTLTDVRDEIADSLNTLRNNAVDGLALSDTLLVFNPVIGQGNATDTTLFSYNDVLWGAKWGGSYDLVITKVNVVLYGTNHDVDVAMYYDVNFRDASPTAVFSSNLTVTSTTTGNNATINGSNDTIAKDSFVWLQVKQCTGQPVQAIVSIYGYLEK